MIIEALISFIACFGFGILFNIKGKKLIFAALGGGLSWFCYLFFSSYNISEAISFFLSSIIFSAYSEICARFLKTPVTTIIICSLFPLVPGSGMYYTMYAVITGDIAESIHLGLNTLANAGGLALGVIFVSTITKQLTNIKHLKSKLAKK